MRCNLGGWRADHLVHFHVRADVTRLVKQAVGSLVVLELVAVAAVFALSRLFSRRAILPQLAVLEQMTCLFLRRAVDFAPPTFRDVHGVIGLGARLLEVLAAITVGIGD